MTSVSDQYRNMAAAARSSAALSHLENVRLLHLQSADRLDEIASGMERVAQNKDRNEAAKAMAVRS